MPRFNLTDRQQEAFDFIKAYIKEHGEPPLDTDIQKALRIRSISNVTRIKKSLKRRGWIDFIPRHKRSIIIIEEKKDEN